MKKLGILINCRDYFLPYIAWLISQNEKLFNISGCIDNGELYSEKVPGYKDIRYQGTLEDLALSSDIVLSLGYWKIIPKKILESVPLGILNIHHSYMLKYRGRHCATWAILNGEKVHGSTLHYMSEILDDGPILDSKSVEITSEDTAHSLFLKVNVLGLQLIQKGLPVALGLAPSKELLFPDKDYREYRRKDIFHEIPAQLLDKPEEFIRHIRALTYPGAPKPFFVLSGRKIFLSVEDV